MTSTAEERRRRIHDRLMFCANHLTNPPVPVALVGLLRHVLALQADPAVTPAIAAAVRQIEPSCVVRPAPGAPAVFVFGDSHAHAMFRNHPGVHTIYYYGCTMHAIGRDGLDFLRFEHFGAEDGDEVVFLFGEIDARVHIERQRRVRGRAIEEVVATLVDAYVAAIDAKVASYRRLGVTVAATLPPSNDPRLVSDPGLAPEGSIADRIDATRRINAALRPAVERRGYRYLDLHGLYAGPDGSLPAGATTDGLHIAGEANALAARALSVLIGRAL